MASNSTKAKKSLALELMEMVKPIKDRAAKFNSSIARNIKKTLLDTIQEEKEAIEDRIYELETFTLDTNVNSGHQGMTREECEERFKELIKKHYELKLLDLKYIEYQKAYQKYFEV